MNTYIYIYILLMGLTTWFMRIAAALIIRKPLENRFLKSFLYYVPYVTLAVMTFPAITEASQTPVAGFAALLAGIAAAWYGAGLFRVACICCLTVLAAELLL